MSETLEHEYRDWAYRPNGTCADCGLGRSEHRSAPAVGEGKPWPEHCEQRAFVQGAKWWEFTKTGGTMWQSDQRDAEAEAVRRYGEPSR